MSIAVTTFLDHVVLTREDGCFTVFCVGQGYNVQLEVSITGAGEVKITIPQEHLDKVNTYDKEYALETEG